MKQIGGHLGLQVLRDGNKIVKIAVPAVDDGSITGTEGVDVYPLAVTAIQNEATMLKRMNGTGYTPFLKELGETYSIQEDLGDSQPVTDGPAFIRECVWLLMAIRSAGLWHSDLTSRNIIVRDNKPYAIDWQESQLIADRAMGKRPGSDGLHLWKAVTGLLPDDRFSRRWLAILADSTTDWRNALVDKTLLDLGCHDGLFCAAAAAEGMNAIGWDHDEQAIRQARNYWGTRCLCLQGNIVWGSIAGYKGSDVALLLSVWPYLLKQYGQEESESFLRSVIHHNRVLYFETQLAGDGPGPEWLKGDDDVAELLGRYGQAVPLATFPVAGRDANRTLWRVTA